MNKTISKKIFIKNNIITPKFCTIIKSSFKKKYVQHFISSKKIKFPIVSKPINEGSSLGVVICKNKQFLFKTIKSQLKKYNEIILEEYIGGQEIQVAIFDNKPLGAIELIPKRFFYDYKAKYTKKQKQLM